MKKDIKQMLREQRLTGDSVGRILIQDMVNTFQQSLPGEKPTEPLLSERDKQQLVSALSTPEDIQTYGQYKLVQRYLLQARLYYTLAWQRAEIHYLRIFSLLGQIENSEEMLTTLRNLPKWTTRKAYDEAIAAEHHRREHLLLSSLACIGGMVTHIMFEEKHPLRQAALGVLEACSDLGDEAILDYTRQHTPELYAETIRRLSPIPGFSEKQLRRQVQNSALLAAGWDLVTPSAGNVKQALFPYGAAEMLGGTPPPDFSSLEEYNFKGMIGHLGAGLKQAYQDFLEACREVNAIRAAVALIGERINVAGLEIFLPTSNPETLTFQVRTLITDISEWALSGDMTEAELTQLLDELFPHAYSVSLQPTDAGLSAARAALHELAIVDNPYALHNLILQTPASPQKGGERA